MGRAELSRDANGVAVFAPHYPHPREEKWFFFVGDPSSNDLLSAPVHVSLLEAEYHAAQASKVSGPGLARAESQASTQQSPAQSNSAGPRCRSSPLWASTKSYSKLYYM